MGWKDHLAADALPGNAAFRWMFRNEERGGQAPSDGGVGGAKRPGRKGRWEASTGLVSRSARKVQQVGASVNYEEDAGRIGLDWIVELRHACVPFRSKSPFSPPFEPTNGLPLPSLGRSCPPRRPALRPCSA